MSWQASTWAIEQQIVLTPSERHVLLVLSNSADQKGRHAFPSVATLAKGTGYGDRAIKKILRRLEEAGAIRLGDQRIAAAHIERADRRPTVYDLAVETLERGEPRSPRDGADGVNGETPRGEPASTNGVNPGSPEPYLNQTEKNARARARDPDGRASPGEGEQPTDAAASGEAHGLGRGTAGEGLHERTGVDASGRVSTLTAQAGWEAKLCAEFILDRQVMRSCYRALWPGPGGGPFADRREIEAALGALSWQGLSKAASWIGWAEDLRDGKPGVQAPPPDLRQPTDILAAIRAAPAAPPEPASPGYLEAKIAFDAARRCETVREACAAARAKAGVEPLPSLRPAHHAEGDVPSPEARAPDREGDQSKDSRPSARGARSASPQGEPREDLHQTDPPSEDAA